MFCVKKLEFEEAQYNCLEISKPGEKNFYMKNFPFISIFDAVSPLIFLRFSEVGFSPFRNFPGLIIIRKKGLLKFLASEIVTERGIFGSLFSG